MLQPPYSRRTRTELWSGQDALVTFLNEIMVWGMDAILTIFSRNTNRIRFGMHCFSHGIFLEQTDFGLSVDAP